MCLLPALFISLAIQEPPPYSRQRRYKAKKGQGQKKTSLSVFFSCRCCYSCKQKSRHPIIPVEEREGETGPSPASPVAPPPRQKKRNRIWQGYHLSKAWIVCESTPLPPLTVLHTRRCSVFPKLYPLPKLFSFFLELFRSFCPALPPPIRNFASQDPLRVCVSCLSVLSVCLSCFVLSARTHDDTFSLFLSIPTPIYYDTDRIVVVSLQPSAPPKPKRKEKKKQKEKESLPQQPYLTRLKRVDVYV